MCNGLPKSYVRCFSVLALPGISGPSSELDEGMKAVVSGSLEDLPDPQRTTVKIYLASNQKGMRIHTSILRMLKPISHFL